MRRSDEGSCAVLAGLAGALPWASARRSALGGVSLFRLPGVRKPPRELLGAGVLARHPPPTREPARPAWRCRLCQLPDRASVRRTHGLGRMSRRAWPASACMSTQPQPEVSGCRAGPRPRWRAPAWSRARRCTPRHRLRSRAHTPCPDASGSESGEGLGDELQQPPDHVTCGLQQRCAVPRRVVDPHRRGARGRRHRGRCV